MFDVSGGDSPFTLDSGEFQVALAEWGTVHHTGYPLYMMLGSPFVNALRWIGVPPSAGASIFSLVWGVLALGGVGMIVLRLTERKGLAITTALTLAFVRSIWIHAVIAEVYSMSLAFTAAILWLTLDLMEQWDDRKGWLLALLTGIGMAHHRLIAIGLPVIGAMVLPTPLRRGQEGRFIRWLLLALLFFALGFLPYLDMPWRVWRGTTWVYGRPDTWDGFWYLFFGTEVEGWQRPVFELPIWIENAREALTILVSELTWPGLIFAIAGTTLALWRRSTRKVGVLLVGFALSYVAFAVLVRQAVLLEADLMTVSLCLLIGAAVGIASGEWQAVSGKRRVANVVAHLIFGIWALTLCFLSRPFVLSLTRDPAGRNYIRQVEQLDAPPGSVVMAPWGWRYFALSYAQRVEGEIREWEIVDHRADFTALTRETGRAYTAADSFYIFTADDFWAPRLGGAHLSSAGPGMVEISAQPKATGAAAPTPLAELGDGLALMDVEVRSLDDGRTDVVLWWTATGKPTRDYSTFVHVSDRDAIDSPDDLTAQSDQIAPVYAWYATTKWTPGEVVREDHVLTLPPDREAKLIEVGMYYREEGGSFVDLGKVEVRRKEETWEVESQK